MSKRYWILFLLLNLTGVIGSTAMAITTHNAIAVLGVIPWTAAATISFLGLTRKEI